ncbi:hypothetical protein [Streptomyces sp. NBC_00648]|uniref:hypothetical protein n=1 Tax=Streptomyces sp. NBC_00648 TaxID=2975797 RepID=UPI003249A1D4
MNAGVVGLVGAAIGAVSAVLGAVVNGWFGRSNAQGQRQLEWTIHQREPRAKAYTEFLDQMTTVTIEILKRQLSLERVTADGTLPPEQSGSAEQLLADWKLAVTLCARVKVEGPEGVARAAGALIQSAGAMFDEQGRYVQARTVGPAEQSSSSLRFREYNQAFGLRQQEFEAAARKALAAGSLPQ